MPKLKFIDDDREHHRILKDLGIIDDLEDWELFKEQERAFDRIDDEIGIDTYLKYVKLSK